jgi:hypothetical protein
LARKQLNGVSQPNTKSILIFVCAPKLITSKSISACLLPLLNYIFFRAQVSVAATHNLSEAAKLTISSHFGLAGVPETANKLMIFFTF